MDRIPKLDDIEVFCLSAAKPLADDRSLVLWNQTVQLRSSVLRPGVSQLYMVCPECDRQCTKLYRLGVRSVCRLCTGLKYASQSHSWERRNLQRVKSLSQELGIQPFSGSHPERPRYMRRSRFANLVLQLRLAEKQRIDHIWPPMAAHDDGLNRFIDAISKPTRVEIHSEVIYEYRTVRRRSGRADRG